MEPRSMGRRSNRRQRVLQAMLDEARRCSTQGLPGPEIVKAVRRVKQDMLDAYRQGIEITPTHDQVDPGDA